jgi:hypothetical protein
VIEQRFGGVPIDDCSQGLARITDIGIILSAPAPTRNIDGEKMNPRTAFLTFATTMLASGAAISAEGRVAWADPTCEYLIIQLPEGNPAEAFGLFASKTKPMPEVGDVVEGDIGVTSEIQVTDKATGKKYSVYHWASGKSAETLVRHSPVHCASRYKKRE